MSEGSKTVGSTPLRVVLVHRYFSPDTPPYANMLLPIARALALDGHDVTVLTCQPSYNRSVVSSAPARERLDGFSVVRWRVFDDRRSTILKLVNLMTYCGRLICGKKYFRGADVVMAATTPPVVVALVCSLLARLHGARFIYHKQDIYPEVVGNRGALGRMLGCVLKAIDRSTDLRAARVVVLSEDMAETSRLRGKGSPNLSVINNFDPWDTDGANDVAPAKRSPDSLDLVFAGNLGRFQGLEHLEALIAHLSDEPRIHWHFFGEGPLRSAMEKLASSGAPVTMYGFRPAIEVADFVRTRADLGVVTLNKGVINSAYPSKTMTYLRQGCPLLAIIETDSELSRMISDENIGITGEQGDIDGLARSLRLVLEDRPGLDAARLRSAEVYRERFGVDVQLSRWVSLMSEVHT